MKKKIVLIWVFGCVACVALAQTTAQIATERLKLARLKKEQNEDLPSALKLNLDRMSAILQNMQADTKNNDEKALKIFYIIKDYFQPIADDVEVAKIKLVKLEQSFQLLSQGQLDYRTYKTAFNEQEKILRNIAKKERKAALRIYLKVGKSKDPLITNMVDKYIQQLSDEKDNLKVEQDSLKKEKSDLRQEKDNLKVENTNLIANNEKLKADYEIYKEKEKNMSHKMQQDSIALKTKLDSVSDFLMQQVTHLSTQKDIVQQKYEETKNNAATLNFLTDSLKNQSNALSFAIKQKENALLEADEKLKNKSTEVVSIAQKLGDKEELEKRQNQKIAWETATILLALLVLFVQYQRYRNTKKGELKVQKMNEQLEKANKQLEEKGVHLVALMRELHHRTKNNLQTISSLFYLQAEEVTDSHLKDVLIEARSRVDTLGIIHKQLYQNQQQHQDLTKINLGDYVKELVKHLLDVNAHPTNPIQTQFDLQALYIELDDAIKVGLLLNELIQNSFKHAFLHIKNPILTIQTSKIGDNLHIIVRDNGPGFPTGMRLDNIQSFGLKLVQLLVEGNEGVLKYANNDGAFFDITLPINN